MRTGAIFARGSCRALKWMALFGVVFALGAVEAAAQPTLHTVVWTPESATVEIDASEAVWTQGGQAIAEAFTVTWTGKTTPSEGVSHTISGTVGGAEDDFTVTFDTAIPTYAAGVAVTYTAPSPADPTKDILDTDTSGYTPVATGAVTTHTEKDVRPMIAAIEDMTFEKDKQITAFQLPDATGNDGTTGFTYIVSDLPDGLTFDADGADGASTDAATRADDRMVAGTPTMVTDDAQIVTYTVTDGDDATASPDSASVRFTITVTDRPETPDKPTVTPTPETSGSLDVEWDEPEDNNSTIFDYEVQYREVGEERWMMHTADLGVATEETIGGLEDGTEYEFQVRARNDVGWSEYSASGEGTPMASQSRPDAPDMPMLTTGGVRRQLVVTWNEPDANGRPITKYDMRYREVDTSDWTNRLDLTTRSTTITELDHSTEYEAQVRAYNANGESDWSVSGMGTTMDAPVVPHRVGEVIKTQLIGDSVERKTIGGTRRTHVPEGANDVKLEVTVEITNDEIGSLSPATHAEVNVQIQEGSQDGSLPNWVSPIDEEGDADFPNAIRPAGRLSGTVRIKLPTIKASDRGSAVRELKGEVRVLFPEDDHEAESDGFYIQVSDSPHISIADSRMDDLKTLDVVIEDNDPQKVTVKQGRKIGAAANPTMIYEGVDTDFTITADPERIQLPLTVELDMLDLAGATVSAAKISIETASVVLNADRSGTAAANSENVTVHLPASDGDRKNDPYTLHASVNLYSLAAGGFDDIAVYDHHIEVVDVHKLPLISVDPMAGTVKEGGELKLELSIDRNPANTIATDPETRQYTDEALTITVSANASSTATAADYVIPASVAVPENKPYKRIQTVEVTVNVETDEDIDAMEMLVVDFVANGDKTENGPRPDDAPAYDAQATLTIEEGTDAMVSAKDNAYDVIQGVLGTPPTLMTGMSAELMGSNLFDYDSSAVSVAYGTSVEGGAVTASAGGGTITLMGAMAGDAKVTITATGTPTSSSLVVNQTKANVAQMTFPVMVKDEDLVFMVAGPDDMNLAEGGMGGMVTVTTNRPVTENTEVMLMRDGSSSAAEDDYMLEPPLVTIMAGHKMGSTMVMATEDNMAEDMEMLTLFLVVDGMQMTDKSVSFYLWDAAVPALPVIAQLLLAAFLALGGYRRYRRR